jgi:lipopolysaccharide export system protein LptA
MRRLLSLLLLVLPVAARAQAIDMTKGGPVEVTSSNGMDWHQNEQTIIARGDAKAVRGDVTVTADQLIAHYRKKTPLPGAPPPPPPPPGQASATPDTGNNEIYRLEAEGNVHIFTATDQAFGDHAVYDIDQSVLVLTGHDLHIITPQQVMSARDVMEYWSQKHMAVGRGDAVVNTNDGRRLAADILVGYTVDPNAPAQPGAPKPVPVKATDKPGDKQSDPLGAGGKLQRVDAFGHVEVRTATEIIHADKGVYVPDTGIARLAGNVHLTRGQNQLNGDHAVVNLRTGISTVTRDPGGRVEGLVVPNDPSNKGAGSSGAGKPGATAPQAGKTGDGANAADPKKEPKN